MFNGPALKVAEGPLQNGLITVENRLMIFVDLLLIPDLPAVKRPNGCRLSGVGTQRPQAYRTQWVQQAQRSRSNVGRAHFRAERGGKTISALFPLTPRSEACNLLLRRTCNLCDV